MESCFVEKLWLSHSVKQAVSTIPFSFGVEVLYERKGQKLSHCICHFRALKIEIPNCTVQREEKK